MSDFPHRVERTVTICAPIQTVFRYFTDCARWASWWGQGSTIDPQLGGKVYIRHPNGVETEGEVLEVDPPERIVFTYGYASGKPIPLDGSRVTIRLEADSQGTRLHLLHEFREPVSAEEHVQGWRFQLSVFSNVVANEVHAACGSVIDKWFAAWRVGDVEARTKELTDLVAPAIQFWDRYSQLEGIGDVCDQISAYQRFMPDLLFERHGDVRHCQGTVLTDWIAVGADAKEKMSGTSVFRFAPDGRIDSVISFTNPTSGS
ncbi:MAG: SRPBCC domain-containing protein [Acidobacteriota bacterium]